LLSPRFLTGSQPDIKELARNVRALGLRSEPTGFRRGVASSEQFFFCLQARLFTRDAKWLFQAYEELSLGGLFMGTVPHSVSINALGGFKDRPRREGLRYASKNEWNRTPCQ